METQTHRLPQTVKPSRPVLFVKQGANYERDLTFARLMYDGILHNAAAERVGLNDQAGRQVLFRLRQRATVRAGHPISDTMVLRLMFDRDQAEADLRRVRETDLATTENPGKAVAA